MVMAISLFAIIILTAGGLYFWWQHYTTTPSYSLALLVDAAQRNDMAAVDTIVDTDKVVENFAGEVIDKAVGRYGVALGSGLRPQIEALTPKLLPAIKEGARAALVARVKEISAQANQKPFVLIALGLPYFVKVEVRGDTAQTTAVVRNQQVQLGLARAGNRWKVVAMRDEALVQRSIDQVIKNMPVIGLDNEKKAPEPRRNRRILSGIPDLRLPQ